MLMNRRNQGGHSASRSFLLIDGIESMADDTVVACKTVTGDEEFFAVIFPNILSCPES